MRLLLHGFCLGGFCLGGFRFRGVALRVLAAEALDAAGGVHQLLLSGEEWMAGGADFYVDIAMMSRACNERVSAGAMHPHFVIVGMSSCLHVSVNALSNH